ncbi:3-methyladenine DNA glycosylase [Aeromicrobium sp. Root495]|uniref:DNA-3-methyladenine glycosylase family protein n=1 Tax=Aeromicrobium sp. Root495 TaxID=1736550 RepID=UPI0006F73EB3|nr:DNA-3-methyladenine glycosylase [Aeromicrobium sp. Root495]KQY59247.1 3-methyladenine DNA glycosylase [Aeromicrobium sp. Root495]
MAEAQERTVTFDAPVDVRRTLSTIRRGPADPAFLFDGPVIWRTTREVSGPVTVRIHQVGAETVRAQAWGPGAQEHLELLPAVLGAHDDVSGFRPEHPLLLDALRRFPGLRVPRTGRVLEALVPAVLEQKVLGTDAFLSWRQLLRRHGSPAPGPAPERLRVVPTAAEWAALPSWEWHLAGVDPKRYRTAQACVRVADSVERLAAAGDLEATYRGLRSIHGVGAWTAAEVGSRALGDADAVPFGDYHLGSTVGTAFLGRKVETDAEVAALLEPFRPHRGRALRLLQLSPLTRVERRGPRMSRVDHRTI